MRVIVAKDYDEMSRKAADLVISLMQEKPQLKFGLALNTQAQ